jgi:phage baseplate assembly protein V
MTTLRDIAELERARSNLIQVGQVAAVAPPRVRVTLGGVQTAELDVLQRRAGPDATWWLPEVGEQVAVLCPDGDPALGIVLGGLYSAAHPAPADSPDVHRTTYADGAVIEYDRAAHRLAATLPAGGTADVTAPGGITAATEGQATLTAAAGARVVAPLTVVDGNLEITGTIVMGSGGAGGAIGTIYGSLQQIGGDFETTGTMSAQQDVTAQSISLTGHVHGGVLTGGNNTAEPVAE